MGNLAQVFNGFYILFVNYIFFVKKTKQLASITIGCAFLQLCLSYILVKYLGAIGAAYSTVIVSLVNFIIVMLFSMKIYPMPWFTKN
uniref:polysaccharide biosynthesis C-terminal domain-containing protein n=1 Tax=Sphingobacterium daejeonense TaxID=371142 RepID=UPI0014854AE5